MLIILNSYYDIYINFVFFEDEKESNVILDFYLGVSFNLVEFLVKIIYQGNCLRNPIHL